MELRMNNERLIAEVRKFPCLYNTDDEEYRIKELKSQCWVKVAKRVLQNERWNELSELEIRQMSKEVQKRWKNLRDAYTRALRGQIERGACKPYIYEKQMNFLVPGSASHQSPVVIKQELEENLVICEPDVNTSHLEDSQDDAGQQPPACGSETHLSSSRRRLTRDHDPDQDYNLYLVDTNSCKQNDDDTMFLMSLVPSLRQIPLSAKLDARIKILEALKPFVPFSK